MSLKGFLFSSFSNQDLGLLVIRAGIGLSMVAFHGYGKITGGPEGWERTGGAMARFGISFAPVFWGFMAAFSEFFCAILVILGLFFRPATILLACTMIVASARHLSLPADAAGAGWKGASHALEFLAVFLGLLAAGPGKYRIGGSKSA
jgi:putative oxidoreductase